MHPEASDAALWVRVRADDESAFAVVFDRYHSRVERTVATALTDVAAADVPAVAAEVFHTAWQRRSSVEVETSVWPWLKAVTARLCANERRRCLRQDRLAARARSTGPIELVEPDHAAYVAMHVAFTTALSRLGSAEAAVAELSIVHDLSVAEVAARLSVPVGTVKSRLHRARRQLRQHLGSPSAPLRAPATAGSTWPVAAGPGPAPTRADVAYATDSPRQRLDLWTPTHDGPAPVVVLLHGGGHEEGPPTVAAGKVRPLLDAGLAVASVDHRPSGEGRVPAAVDDVAAAVRLLTSLATVDGDRVALWGESAGADVACVAGALAGRVAPWSDDGADPLPRLTAVVGWCGDQERGRDGLQPYLATARADDLPEFAIAATAADDVVAPGRSALLVDALRARGASPWVTWLAADGGDRVAAELLIPTVDWLQQVFESPG